MLHNPRKGSPPILNPPKNFFYSFIRHVILNLKKKKIYANHIKSNKYCMSYFYLKIGANPLKPQAI